MIAASARSRASVPLEVRCEDASVTLVSQTAGAQAPFTARLGEILVIAQIYQPKLLIAEFKAPATLADRGQPPSLKVNWTTGRSSVSGCRTCRSAPPSCSTIPRSTASTDRCRRRSRAPTMSSCTAASPKARRRINPVIETVLQISGGSVQEVHPLLAAPFDADIETKLTGLKDFSPKPWPERFREMQAAGGNVEIVRSRIQQGDLVSVAAGTLSLNARGGSTANCR
jgi:hypothetical protein